MSKILRKRIYPFLKALHSARLTITKELADIGVDIHNDDSKVSVSLIPWNGRRAILIENATDECWICGTSRYPTILCKKHEKECR